MARRFLVRPRVKAHALAWLLFAPGCAAIAANIDTQQRRGQALPIPSLTGGKRAAAADYPRADGLPTIALPRDAWNEASPMNRVLCELGAAPKRDDDLKQVQDAIGRANLYKDVSASRVGTLPLAATEVESVTLECSAQRVVLGVNGEAIAANWISGQVGAAGDTAFLQLFALERKSGEALWVYLALDKNSGKLQRSGVAAMNLGAYLPPQLLGVRARAMAMTSQQGEYFFLAGPESGLYLAVESEKALVARFTVAAAGG